MPATTRRSARLVAGDEASNVATPASLTAGGSSKISRKRKAADHGSVFADGEASATLPNPPKSNAFKFMMSNNSPFKRPKLSKQSSSYAPPSTYSHLPHLPDAIAPNLHLLFIGLNPGIQTARDGHAYAHPSNLFWKLLYSSAITPVPCQATEDREMPERYKLGFTNIVSRPSRNGAELSRVEMDEGVSVLEEKCRRWRPAAVCIVGKSIWESVWRVRHGRAIKKEEFRYGWQDEVENMGKLSKKNDGKAERIDGVVYDDENWKGSRVFVATSTSGLAASLSPAEKQVIWQQLGSWVEERRNAHDSTDV